MRPRHTRTLPTWAGPAHQHGAWQRRPQKATTGDDRSQDSIWTYYHVQSHVLTVTREPSSPPRPILTRLFFWPHALVRTSRTGEERCDPPPSSHLQSRLPAETADSAPQVQAAPPSLEAGGVCVCVGVYVCGVCVWVGVVGVCMWWGVCVWGVCVGGVGVGCVCVCVCVRARAHQLSLQQGVIFLLVEGLASMLTAAGRAGWWLLTTAAIS